MISVFSKKKRRKRGKKSKIELIRKSRGNNKRKKIKS